MRILGSGAWEILRQPLRQHLLRHLQRDLGMGDVDGDGIPFFHQADGPAGGSLRADMANGSALRDAPENRPSVCQGHRLIQLHACQSRGGVQHLPHTGAALGAFVPVTTTSPGIINLARINGGNGLLLAVKYPGRAGMALHLWRHCTALDHASIRGQVAPQESAGRRFPSRGPQWGGWPWCPGCGRPGVLPRVLPVTVSTSSVTSRPFFWPAPPAPPACCLQRTITGIWVGPAGARWHRLGVFALILVATAPGRWAHQLRMRWPADAAPYWWRAAQCHIAGQCIADCTAHR